MSKTVFKTRKSNEEIYFDLEHDVQTTILILKDQGYCHLEYKISRKGIVTRIQVSKDGMGVELHLEKGQLVKMVNGYGNSGISSDLFTKCAIMIHLQANRQLLLPNKIKFGKFWAPRQQIKGIHDETVGWD
jgi:hypothetical protein